MLTKDLLVVNKRKPNIQPQFREPEEYRELAREAMDRYEIGEKRKEIDEAVSALESHGTFKFVRGLSKLLERKAEFEMDSPVEPAELRRAVYREGYVTDEAERRRAIERAAEDFDISPETFERSLWADRESEMVLTSLELGDMDAEGLIRQYNLSLAQTLLFDAVELEFNVSENFQQIFRMIKYLGLIYSVDSSLNVNVTGPAALFKKTRKYGTSFAKLLPHIMKAEEWEITAQVETEVGGEKRIYEFELSSDTDSASDQNEERLFPEGISERQEKETYHSEVEREFASRISSLAEKWEVKREPTILRSGNRVMIPDFSFRRDGKEFYLEVVGFWTPEYLEKKIEKVKNVESEKPLLLAVDENLKCTKEEFGSSHEVFFYDKKIPPKPILKRLQNLDEELAEEDLAILERKGLDVADGKVIGIDELAEEKDVVEEAVERFVEENLNGLISNGKYVPPSVVDDIKEEIESLESDRLTAVNDVLERYGLAQNALTELGYRVSYTSLDQSEARIEKEG